MIIQRFGLGHSTPPHMYTFTSDDVSSCDVSSGTTAGDDDVSSSTGAHLHLLTPLKSLQT